MHTNKSEQKGDHGDVVRNQEGEEMKSMSYVEKKKRKGKKER
jgi:hypothetical protein